MRINFKPGQDMKTFKITREIFKARTIPVTNKYGINNIVEVSYYWPGVQ